MDREKESELTFEEAMARLEEIVALLEKGEQKLEDSLILFEEGVRLTRFCQAVLDRAEERIRVLEEDGQERDFLLEGGQAQ